MHRSSLYARPRSALALGRGRRLERLPRRGYIVAPITINAIQNLYEVRLVLEVAGAGFAAERADEVGIAEMAALADYPQLEASEVS